MGVSSEMNFFNYLFRLRPGILQDGLLTPEKAQRLYQDYQAKKDVLDILTAVAQINGLTPEELLDGVGMTQAEENLFLKQSFADLNLTELDKEAKRIKAEQERVRLGVKQHTFAKRNIQMLLGSIH
jgi:hypothetical protein